MIVFCDIDHVLSDAGWRDHMLGRWDEYHAAGDRDEPIHEMVWLVAALRRSGATVIGLTARPEKWRALTEEWLARHGIELNGLLMRPSGDLRTSPELKLALALELYSAGEIAMMIDDREDILKAFRGAGITTLLVSARERTWDGKVLPPG